MKVVLQQNFSALFYQITTLSNNSYTKIRMLEKSNYVVLTLCYSSRSGSTQHTMDNDWLHAVPALGSCSSYGDGVKGHWVYGMCQLKANVFFTIEVGDFEQAYLHFFSRLRCSWKRTTTTISPLFLPTKLLWSSPSLPMATIWFRSKPWVKVVKVWAASPSTSINWVSSILSSFKCNFFLPMDKVCKK